MIAAMRERDEGCERPDAHTVVRVRPPEVSSLRTISFVDNGNGTATLDIHELIDAINAAPIRSQGRPLATIQQKN